MRRAGDREKFSQSLNCAEDDCLKDTHSLLVENNHRDMKADRKLSYCPPRRGGQRGAERARGASTPLVKVLPTPAATIRFARPPARALLAPSPSLRGTL